MKAIFLLICLLFSFNFSSASGDLLNVDNKDLTELEYMDQERIIISRLNVLGEYGSYFENNETEGKILCSIENTNTQKYKLIQGQEFKVIEAQYSSGKLSKSETIAYLQAVRAGLDLNQHWESGQYAIISLSLQPLASGSEPVAIECRATGDKDAVGSVKSYINQLFSN